MSNKNKETIKRDIDHYTRVRMGTAAMPLPDWSPQTGRVGVLKGPDHVINFYTERQHISRSGHPEGPVDKDDKIDIRLRVYADLMRNLPSRTMLPHLKHELIERDPSRVDWKNHSFICGYMGAPSIGKSYMIKTLGKLVHPRGALYLNCKNKDMNILFSETVFDTRAANREKAAIDARIASGNKGNRGLSQDNIERLRHVLGDAFHEEVNADGLNQIKIDWNAIHVAGETIEEQKHHREVLGETLIQVCEEENIPIKGDLSQIGITTRDGIAVRAADPKSADYGRPILLDEINRAKPGTLQSLYEYFALLADPKVPKLQVTGGENRPFVFERDKLPPSYRLNFTGNPNVRGMGSASLDRPLWSRFGIELDIRTVPDAEQSAFADRIAAALTGVPLMQLYYSNKEHFDDHPHDLVAVAKKYQRMGKTDQELAALENNEGAKERTFNIENAYKIARISEQMADFFSDLKSTLDPESSVHSGGGVRYSAEYETYLESIEVDLRLVTKLLEKSGVIIPEPEQHQIDNFSAFLENIGDLTHEDNLAEMELRPDLEARIEKRGDRLERYLMDWMRRVVVPADAGTRNIPIEECEKLLETCLRVAANNGIGDPRLREAKKGGVPSLKKLYNFDPLSQPKARFELLSELLSELKQNSANDNIAPDELRKTVTEHLRSKNNDSPEQIKEQIKDQVKKFPVINIGSGGGDLIVEAAVNDTIETKRPGDILSHKPDLIPLESFLLTMAQPEFKRSTLEHLWNENLIDSMSLEPQDEALQMLTGQSESGVAISTVGVEHHGETVSVHIIKLPDDATIVVSPDLDERIANMLSSADIIHLSPQDEDAASFIDQIIEDALVDRPGADQIKTSMRSAFIVRNQYISDHYPAVDKGDQYTRKTIGQLLVTSPEKLKPRAVVELQRVPGIN